MSVESTRQVNVPLCVGSDLENEQIKRGRVYFELPVPLQHRIDFL